MRDETLEYQQPKSVGLIGLGNMGWWMALNLHKALDKSKRFFIYDIVPDVLETYLEKVHTLDICDVIVCKNAREVAVNADFIFTVVPAPPHVRSVYLEGENAILTGPVDGKTFVDCSTIDPATSLRVGEAIRSKSSSARFYDAPVSGGVTGAEAGTLTILAGASEADSYFQNVVKPLLLTMGRTVVCVGARGHGLVAKLCNNYLSGICAIATSEAMNIGMRHGIDAKLLSDIFNKSTGANWQNANFNPVPGVCPNTPPSKGYQGGFKVQMMVKDFNLAIQAAGEVEAKLALGDAALAAYVATSEDPKCRNLDNRVVYRWLGGRE